MNWLSKIFRTESKADNSSPINTDMLIEKSIPKDLFVEDQFYGIKENDNKEQYNVLEFFNQDFASIAFEDGYKYHSKEILENRLKSIKADFRMKLDILIDQNHKRMLDLKTNLIDIAGISERLENSYKLSIEALEIAQIKLEKEKELSVCDEGWIMKAIHEYRDNFIKGFERYSEEKLIANSTGLF